jgi:ribose-phosphate pyrophosphokinase
MSVGVKFIDHLMIFSVTMFADRLKIDFALIHKYNTSKDCPTAAETERDPSQKPQYASLSAISSVDSLVSQFNADTPLRMSTGSRAAGNGAAVENSAEDSEDETSSIGDEDVSRPAVTLVGDVRGKVAFIVDDMIDSANSFTGIACIVG